MQSSGKQVQSSGKRSEVAGNEAEGSETVRVRYGGSQDGSRRIGCSDERRTGGLTNGVVWQECEVDALITFPAIASPEGPTGLWFAEQIR